MQVQTPTQMTAARFIRAWTAYEVSAKTNEIEARDYIEYCAAGQAQFATTQVLVKHAERIICWPDLSPAYEAWKKGQEVPLNGTPLAAWPGLTPQQAEIFRATGLKTVEDIAGMTDSTMGRVKLPGVRNIRDMAQRFLAAADNRKFEQELASRDRQLADMQAKLEQMAEMLAASGDPVADADVAEIGEIEEAEGDVVALPPKRGPGRPPKIQSQIGA